MRKFLEVVVLFSMISCASETHRNENNPFESDKISSEELAKKNQLQPLKIIYTGRISGEYDVCGCAVNPKGGLERRHNFTQRTKEGAPSLILDAGNLLFASGKLDPSKKSEQLAVAKTLMAAQVKIGVLVQNIGENDLSAGKDFLLQEGAKAGLPMLSSNLDLGPAVMPFKKVEVSPGFKVLILGFASPSLDGAKDPILVLSDMKKQMLDINLVVVLSDLGLAWDKRLAENIFLPHIILDSRESYGVDLPHHQAWGLISHVQFQGAQAGYYDLFIGKSHESKWFNPGMQDYFKGRWAQAQNEINEISDKSAESLDYSMRLEELKKLKSELNEYAPGNLDQKNIYTHQTFDLTEIYAGKNELTPFVEKFKKGKKK